MRILIIEDDAATAAHVANGLKEVGHLVDHAPNARDGLFLATGHAYDVMIVDRMLGGMDGLGIVKTLRSTGVKTPVLFLTALSGIDERVSGLEAGADDYLIKPFAFSELLARIEALARRPPIATVQTELRVADLQLDLVKRTATRSGRRIDLQPREFRLLEYLMKNAGRVVTRTMLLEHVWEFHFDPKTNIVETHISRLRAKMDRGQGPELIQTVRGSGYMLRAPS
jgi:two-component system OmpR family response regulator